MFSLRGTIYFQRLSYEDSLSFFLGEDCNVIFLVFSLAQIERINCKRKLKRIVMYCWMRRVFISIFLMEGGG